MVGVLRPKRESLPNAVHDGDSALFRILARAANCTLESSRAMLAGSGQSRTAPLTYVGTCAGAAEATQRSCRTNFCIAVLTLVFGDHTGFR
jgi:hypothetical protein